MAEVAVIIPFLTGSKFIGKCIESIRNQENVHCIIFPEEEQPNEHGFGDNGFTKNVNNGLKKALDSDRKFDYFAILNDDIELEPTYFSECIVKLYERTDYGMITGRIGCLRPDEEDLISWGGSKSPYPHGDHLKGLESKNELMKQTEERWLPFVACVIKRSCLISVGLLDERMKWVHSDADFCFRARYNGWKCIYFPKVKVKHWWSGSMNNTCKDVDKLNIECNLDYDRFVDKWINDGRTFQKLDKELVNV